MAAIDAPVEKKPFSFGHQLVFFMLIVSPLVYIAVLFILQNGESEKEIPFENEIPLTMIITLLVACCVVMNVLIYFFFIPRMLEPAKRSAATMADTFGKAIIVIFGGADLPATCGVIIGLLEITTTGTISWIIELPFFFLGMANGLILYKYCIVSPPKPLD